MFRLAVERRYERHKTDFQSLHKTEKNLEPPNKKENFSYCIMPEEEKMTHSLARAKIMVIHNNYHNALP